MEIHWVLFLMIFMNSTQSQLIETHRSFATPKECVAYTNSEEFKKTSKLYLEFYGGRLQPYCKPRPKLNYKGA